MLLASVGLVAAAAIVALVLLAQSGSVPTEHEKTPSELFGPLSFDEVHTHILNMRMRRSQLKEKLKEAALEKREHNLMNRVRAQLAARRRAHRLAEIKAHPMGQSQQLSQQPPAQQQMYAAQPPQYAAPQPMYQPQQQMYQQPQQPQYMQQPQYQQQQPYQAYQQQQPVYQQQPMYPQQQQQQPQYQQQPMYQQQNQWSAQPQQLAQQPANPNNLQELVVSAIPKDSGAGQVQERSMAESSERAFEAFMVQQHHGHLPPGVRAHRK